MDSDDACHFLRPSQGLSQLRGAARLAFAAFEWNFGRSEPHCFPRSLPERLLGASVCHKKRDGNETQGLGPQSPGCDEAAASGSKASEDQAGGRRGGWCLRGEVVTDWQLQQEQRTQTWAVCGLLARGWLPGVCGT